MSDYNQSDWMFTYKCSKSKLICLILVKQKWWLKSHGVCMYIRQKYPYFSNHPPSLPYMEYHTHTFWNIYFDYENKIFVKFQWLFIMCGGSCIIFLNNNMNLFTKSAKFYGHNTYKYRLQFHVHKCGRINSVQY